MCFAGSAHDALHQMWLNGTFQSVKPLSTDLHHPNKEHCKFGEVRGMQQIFPQGEDITAKRPNSVNIWCVFLEGVGCCNNYWNFFQWIILIILLCVDVFASDDKTFTILLYVIPLLSWVNILQPSWYLFCVILDCPEKNAVNKSQTGWRKEENKILLLGVLAC